MAPFHTLLLAARLLEASPPGFYARVVDFCERFSARVWAIRGLRSNAGESSIRWSARDLYLGMEPETVLQSLEQRLWHYAPDDAVRASFKPDVQWYYRSAAHKFVLYEYELAMQRSGTDLPQFGDVTGQDNRTTEHILPQKPAADSAWWGFFSREEHARLVHGIGNLVLTRDNSRYGNRDYLDSEGRRGKRGVPGQTEPWCYHSSSNFAREREVASRYDSWTPRTIKERAAEIAEWALGRWPVHLPAAPDTAAEDDHLVEDDDPVTESELV